MSIKYTKITSKNGREEAYEGIVIERNGFPVLELRISILAELLLSWKCLDIHEWLYNLGRPIIDELKDFKVMEIKADDLQSENIIGSWQERELNK